MAKEIINKTKKQPTEWENIFIPTYFTYRVAIVKGSLWGGGMLVGY